MKRFLIFLLSFISCLQLGFTQVKYESYFTSKMLRVDCVIAGNDSTVNLYAKSIHQQPIWGGRRGHLNEDLKFGRYKYLLVDSVSGKTIYTDGLCTLFEEWQTTAEAKTTSRAFEMVLTMPFPLKTAKLIVKGCNRKQEWKELYSTYINPKSPQIICDLPITVPFRGLFKSGEPANCVDLVFIAEGYTSSQMDKFYRDASRLSNFLLAQEPFSKVKSKFNIWAVGCPSIDSGTDNPLKKEWKNTALNTSFNTFNTDRYLQTFSVFDLHNYLANVPVDHVVVLVNSPVYGGGGVYNYFSVSSVDDEYSDIVMVHEIGHGLGALGDEYYTSDVSYSNFYDLSVEPWEPNLSTLVQFSSKWKSLVKPSTPIPTPNSTAFINEVGAFEGAGYIEKGIYRPAYDCTMNSLEAKGFCAVCQHSIVKIINHLTTR